MIVAAAVCPHPPALVPQIGLGLPEIETTRAAVRDAVTSILAAGPERLVVIGPAKPPVDADESAGGSFAGFGVEIRAGGSDPVLPAAYAVGAWLLDRAGWNGPRLYTSSRPEIADRDALLVLADADTSVGVSAPTHGDPRAARLEPIITAALAGGDPAALAALDVDAAATWDGTGIAPLRLMGELVAGETANGARVVARMHHDEAPFGVRYWVADWAIAG